MISGLKYGILAHTETILRLTQIIHLHMHMQIKVFISWHFPPIWQKVFWTVLYLTGTFCTLDILHGELCSVQIGETSTKEIIQLIQIIQEHDWWDDICCDDKYCDDDDCNHNHDDNCMHALIIAMMIIAMIIFAMIVVPMAFFTQKNQHVYQNRVASSWLPENLIVNKSWS